MTLTIPIADLCLLRAAQKQGHDNTEAQDRIVAEIAANKPKESSHVSISRAR